MSQSSSFLVYKERLGFLSDQLRQTIYVHLSYLIFFLSTVVSVDDSEFYFQDRKIELPIIGITIPIYSFFFLGTGILVALHARILIYLSSIRIVYKKIINLYGYDRLMLLRLQPSESLYMIDWFGKGLISKNNDYRREVVLMTSTVIMFINPLAVFYAYWKSLVAHAPILSIFLYSLFLSSIFYSISALVKLKRFELNFFGFNFNKNFFRYLFVFCLIVFWFLGAIYTIFKSSGRPVDFFYYDIPYEFKRKLKVFYGDNGYEYLDRRFNELYVKKPLRGEDYLIDLEKIYINGLALQEPIDQVGFDEFIGLEMKSYCDGYYDGYCDNYNNLMDDEDFLNSFNDNSNWKRKRDLYYKKFKSYQYSFTDLRRLNIVGGVFAGSNFYKSRLSKSIVKIVDMEGANFSKVAMNGSHIYDSSMINIVANGAVFSGSNMKNVDFRYSHLKDSIFNYSSFNDVDFRYSDLTGAKFHAAVISSSDFRHSSGLESENFNCSIIKGSKKVNGENAEILHNNSFSEDFLEDMNDKGDFFEISKCENLYYYKLKNSQCGSEEFDKIKYVIRGQGLVGDGKIDDSLECLF